MRRNPERLAWTVLLISLFMCLGLAVSVPLTVGSIINDTSETAAITLKVQQGTALVRLPGSDGALGVTTSRDNLPEGTSIRADENVQALLTLSSPYDNSILETVQIYGSTDLEIVRAQLPRFQMSARPYQIELSTNIGRVRVNVADSRRPIEAVLITPQARTTLQEGSYAFEVSNDETQLTVREGAAQVSAQGEKREVKPQQRTVVKLNDIPSGVLSPERNLVTNGNFRVPLNGTWDTYNDLQNPREQPGTVTIQTVDGQRSAVFERRGSYHAETGMRQSINADVRGFTSLRLHFVIHILGQDVPVCGSLGTECPMMFQLEYKDQEGNNATFLQGFYAVPDVSGANPPYNLGSGNREEHQRIPLNGAYTYEANLIETLKPTYITSITFYASGHSYHSSVAEVELLGEQ